MVPIVIIGLALGIIGLGSFVAGRAAEAAEEIDDEEALEVYALAQTSADVETIRDYATQLYRANHQTLANNISTALRIYTTATTEFNVSQYYWDLVGLGFLGLANRLSAERNVFQ